MREPEHRRKRAIATDLEEPVTAARNLAAKLGLEPYPVRYWIVDHDEMNELIAYGGFQRRYPHWRWGMQYDRQQKQDRYTGARAFEIVNNDNPSHAFLQESNSLADQKAVITHVEAHADFFANNDWFGLFTDRRSDSDDVDAAAMLERHSRAIEAYMADPEIDRSDVERWIDHVLSLEDTIDQHRPYRGRLERDVEPPDLDDDLQETLENLDLSSEVTSEVFDDEWLEARAADDGDGDPSTPETDVLGFLREYGKAYDPEEERAVELTDWQRDILEILREEAYYFAPQQMTKVMNEGWAALWESRMMADEAFAGDDEVVEYADHMASVLASPGLNPYSLGLALWQYIENVTNRREVVEHLLRVDGITWRTLTEDIDFDAVLDRLEPPAAIDSIDSASLSALETVPDAWVDADALEAARAGRIDVDRYPWRVLSYEGLARRHYSLVKPANRGVFERIGRDRLEELGRYIFDSDRYDSVDEAVAAVDFTAGWDRLFDVRESHNDVTFLDEFLTAEFVRENDYFTYEYSQATGQFHVASTDPEDVKRKLLLQFTNFGKPTITVADGNYDNAGELLLEHEYNGIELDFEQAKAVLERVFELWGRPVNLLTIRKELDDHDVEVAKRRNREPTPDERGVRLRHDGTETTVERVDWTAVEHLAADDVDYDTKPDEWLA
ncbi:SpoVR family protein [Halovivax asiaticus JCM 14624]|uniref:SpoVR family protein n=1 Tax=Halovivax asiaticus JCM 14624 TaxID=1227490 RepID=M0BBW0_9EURY|nr:SpoVR family protein [Halovivax asiaticus]ELZ07134.1 SpoVR family protein [Halovivax asiaticus JCM 14624]